MTMGDKPAYPCGYKGLARGSAPSTPKDAPALGARDFADHGFVPTCIGTSR